MAEDEQQASPRTDWDPSSPRLLVQEQRQWAGAPAHPQLPNKAIMEKHFRRAFVCFRLRLGVILQPLGLDSHDS